MHTYFLLKTVSMGHTVLMGHTVPMGNPVSMGHTVPVDILCLWTYCACGAFMHKMSAYFPTL